jgi:hypothetical protein
MEWATRLRGPSDSESDVRVRTGVHEQKAKDSVMSTGLIASPMAPSPDFPFPVELLTEIVKLLPTPDQRALSLTSQVTRIYSIPFAFRDLQYTGEVVPKIQNIHQASQGVKDVIRFVKFRFCSSFSPNILKRRVQQKGRTKIQVR